MEKVADAVFDFDLSRFFLSGRAEFPICPHSCFPNRRRSRAGTAACMATGQKASICNEPFLAAGGEPFLREPPVPGKMLRGWRAAWRGGGPGPWSSVGSSLTRPAAPECGLLYIRGVLQKVPVAEGSDPISMAGVRSGSRIRHRRRQVQKFAVPGRRAVLIRFPQQMVHHRKFQNCIRPSCLHISG